MSTQTPVKPETSEPTTTPNTPPASPGTTTPAARVLARGPAVAVLASPTGASIDVPQPVAVQIPGQLSLFGPEVA